MVEETLAVIREVEVPKDNHVQVRFVRIVEGIMAVEKLKNNHVKAMIASL